jgi:hypothetical protein
MLRRQRPDFGQRFQGPAAAAAAVCGILDVDERGARRVAPVEEAQALARASIADGLLQQLSPKDTARPVHGGQQNPKTEPTPTVPKGLAAGVRIIADISQTQAGGSWLNRSKLTLPARPGHHLRR